MYFTTDEVSSSKPGLIEPKWPAWRSRAGTLVVLASCWTLGE